VITASHCPASVPVVMSAGHVICGSSSSVKITLKLQVAVLPAASVACYVFVVVPTGKAAPLARPAICTVVEPGQLSFPVGGV